jgi:hypothetical protein
MTDTTTASTAMTRLPRPHHGDWVPSRAALAARSRGRVEELPEGSAEHTTAVTAHFAEFMPSLRRGRCRLRTVD